MLNMNPIPILQGPREDPASDRSWKIDGFLIESIAIFQNNMSYYFYGIITRQCIQTKRFNHFHGGIYFPISP
jgi:hypothetical protein